MLRIKQTVKSDWLKENLMTLKESNVFPMVAVVQVFEFDDASAADFDEGVWTAINNNQMIIPVIVDSFGGQVYSLLRMLDTIASAKAHGATIVTLGKSKCMSCGSVLVAAGTKGYRFMQPQTTMMIHEVSSSGRGKNMELQSDAAETDRLNQLLLEKLAEFAGKPKAFFSKLIHKVGHADMFISAKDVLTLGLIDHVGEASLSMELELKVSVLGTNGKVLK